MSVSRRRLLLGSSSAFWLAACGGGGGGTSDPGAGGGGGGGGSGDGSWLTFSPQPMTADLMEGTSTEIEVTAKSSRTIADALYVKIIDAKGVTTGTATITQNSSTEFETVMQVSPELSVGSHDGEFEVWLYTDAAMTQPYEGSPWRVPYEISVGARHAVHRLLADRRALALAGFPTSASSRLSGSIRVTDNQGKATPWRAASSQSWLSVTASGQTSEGSDVITVTADAAALPLDQVSYATVTISSTDGSVEGKESIRVGVWRGASDPTPRSLTMETQERIADRAGPFFYSHNRGESIDVVHVYRGVVVATLDAGAGAKLGRMATSSDGKRLFAVDQASKSVVVFDLLKRDRLANWPMSGFVRVDTPIEYLRPNGIEVLAVGKNLVSASTGEAYATVLPEPSTSFAASPLGDVLYATDIDSTPRLKKWAMDYIDYDNIGLTVEQTLERRQSSGDFPIRHEIAVSPDGSQLYSFSARVRTTDFALLDKLPDIDPDANNPDAYLQEVVVGSDGRVHATYDGGSLVVYGATGNKLARVTVKDELWLPRVSSDGLMTSFGEWFFDKSPDQLRIEPVLP